MKTRISLQERLRRFFTPKFLLEEQRKQTREYRRWANGWKRHCSSRAMIRRIGSRARALELGIIK